MQDLGSFWGASTFDVAVYVDGSLQNEYGDGYSCFELSPSYVGACPGGAHAQVVITCNNMIQGCPVLFSWCVRACAAAACPGAPALAASAYPDVMHGHRMRLLLAC